MIADYSETFETAIPRKVSNSTPPHYNMVITSAVKRLKYLIAINRIYVIVNYLKFVSILNVPSFIYFFHHFIFILMPLSTWKSGLACFMLMFYFIESQHCQTGRYKIKLQSAHFRENTSTASM